MIQSTLTTHGDNKRLSPIVTLLSHQATPSVDEVKLIASFLEYGFPETQSALLPGLSNLAADSPEVNRAIRAIIQRTPPENPLHQQAVKVLAARGDKEYPWRDFVKDAIRANGKLGIQSNTLEIIALIPADTVLSEVLPALESESQEKLVGGALVGAALGPKAIPIVSRLWHLREARSPQVKYTAILALLQINPLTPDLHNEVSKILVNRYFPVARQLPIKWSHTVAVVDMDRGAFGSLRKERLERLLRSER
jgi:hypothetical protein